MLVIKQSDKRIRAMVEDLLETGGVFIFPTDTVYGIGGGAWDKEALDRVRKLKQRDPSQPFTLHLPSVDKIGRFALLDDRIWRLIERFLPGPITFILPANDQAPPATVLNGKVGIRVPAHSFFQSTMEAVGRPLFGTSVNRSGNPPLTSMEKIIEEFPSVDLVIESSEDCTGISSAIVDITSDPPRPLRGELPKGLL
jgi:tRNA threonylcarbamoyl adenosine modification protein (Sua5/YciO/YrdC/YwlC family)